MTEKTLAVSPSREIAAYQQPMTIEEVVGQVQLVQQVMGRVMQKDEHYGVIPGTNGKPSLLKPGAEKLSMTFRLRPKFTEVVVDLKNEHREYRFVCDLHHVDGTHEGQGVGSCTTMETKYRFRKAEQECPECGKSTIIKGKKEYGGGWLCFGKKGGCGAKFNDGDPVIENQSMGRVEHDNPADYYNTCQKMGKKRAFVDAILTATAASDIFTQDVEDMPPPSSTERQQQPATQPHGGTNGNGQHKPVEEDNTDEVCIQFHEALGDDWKAALKTSGFEWHQEKFSWRAANTPEAAQFLEACLKDHSQAVKWSRMPQAAV